MCTAFLCRMICKKTLPTFSGRQRKYDTNKLQLTKRCCFFVVFYTIPCAIMALATFMKPAMFAPFT